MTPAPASSGWVCWPAAGTGALTAGRSQLRALTCVHLLRGLSGLQSQRHCPRVSSAALPSWPGQRAFLTPRGRGPAAGRGQPVSSPPAFAQFQKAVKMQNKDGRVTGTARGCQPRKLSNEPNIGPFRQTGARAPPGSRPSAAPALSSQAFPPERLLLGAGRGGRQGRGSQGGQGCPCRRRGKGWTFLLALLEDSTAGSVALLVQGQGTWPGARWR